MPMITACYDTTTNRWAPDGGDGTAKYRRIPVPRTPDESCEMYSGDDVNPIRPATAAESAAHAAARMVSVGATTAREDVLIAALLDDLVALVQEITATGTLDKGRARARLHSAITRHTQGA